jgi:DMSO/TMAO reductase YedYZ molybdopterin-dependent catalytic subunit
MEFTRRSFLKRAGGVGGGLVLLGAGGRTWTPEQALAAPVRALQETSFPPGKDPSSLIQHSALTFETRREAFGTSAIVPYERLFVRNNLPLPDRAVVADRDAWGLSVDGVVRPGDVTVAALKALDVVTVATVLQCSGNGRAFFPHETSGSQWGVGAAGCVIWSGVPVRAVAEAFGGVSDGSRFVTATGGEILPDGIARDDVVVERSIPLEKGLEDAFLAWEMNGQPLPLAHGGPLRLVVPGYFGINQVKYISRLAFTSEESSAAIMRTGYRVRPIGESGDPSQPSMWEMSVKSWVNHPSTDRPLQPGRVVVDGVAFGGMRGVRRVELSVDGGRTWQNAPFIGPDLGPYAWRHFAMPVTLTRGTHTLVSRAIDDAGNVQPADRPENHRGYSNTSWRDHAVSVRVV